MLQKQQDLLTGASILERIQRDYTDLLRSASFSLERLFSPDNFRFDEFCKDFIPHSQSSQLIEIVQQYGDKHRIWLANAKHHVTCALYLYPSANFERMLTMMKNLTLGFYLNDVMGRDTFKFLPLDEQHASRKIIESMSSLNDTLYVPPGADPLEHVNAEILREFRDNSPEEWFSNFLQIYCYHIGITHTDGNTTALGHIPRVDEYIDRRCHLGGVHHILLWIEYSNGQFLDWGLLKAMDIDERLKRLHWVTAAFAGLSNDLFSFEKEVIDNSSDSNLVAIIALNNPELTLVDAIIRASTIVQTLLSELIGLIESIRLQTEKISQDYPEYTSKLKTHMDAIVRCVQAIWNWHCYSKRYKRPLSLWLETRLIDKSVSTAI
jgi:hypothetical protein